jgi:hypothetical protein
MLPLLPTLRTKNPPPILRQVLSWGPDPYPQAGGMGGMDEVFDHPPRPFLGVDEVFVYGLQRDKLIENGVLGPPRN